jgi:hypothetical protein
MFKKKGDGLRILFFVFVALATMVCLGDSWIVWAFFFIVWKIGQNIWLMQFTRGNERGLNILISIFWPLAIIFEWQTFDENAADTREHCKSCYRPLIKVLLLRAVCAGANEYPADDNGFQQSEARYCYVCDEMPHIRWVSCTRGKKPCSYHDCLYRQ